VFVDVATFLVFLAKLYTATCIEPCDYVALLIGNTIVPAPMGTDHILSIHVLAGCFEMRKRWAERE
jgi:hypothetical protein